MAKAARFKTLSWNGPVLPEPYKQTIKSLKGQQITSECSEAFELLARYIDTDYFKNKHFQANAFDYFKALLPASLQKLKLSDFEADLTAHKTKTTADKEAVRKLETKEDRAARKLEREANKEAWGFATVDGKKTPIGGYMIEGPGYIITRGDDKRIGGWKHRVKPGDITVNIVGDDTKAAELRKKGFKVVSDNTVLWLFKYDMELTSSKRPINKKVIFAVSSDIFQQGTEVVKYNKAVELLKNWDVMQAHIAAAIISNDEARREAGLIAYLMQKTGLRVGDQRRDTTEYADTVGASSIYTKNITLNGNEVTFNLLGKDSVPFKQSIFVEAFVIKALTEVMKGKKPDDRLFTKADHAEVSALIKEVVADCSPKTFRTAVGTMTLVNELKKQNITAANTELEKKRALFNASLETSRILNHQKNIGKNQKEVETKAEDRVKATTERAAEAKKKGTEQLKKLKKDRETAKTLWTGAKLKEKLAKIDERIIKIKQRVERADDRVDTAKFNFDMKKDTAEISLATARNSYCDPRVLHSLAKDWNYPIEKIYTGKSIERFAWAADTDASFWRSYP